MASSVATPRVPSATYRFQFTPQFGFKQAKEVLSYIHELGISDVYASPFYQASPASSHGYDVVDHQKLNAELGTREDFEAYVRELKQLGMGQISDFVPNHMGIGEPTNQWWMDVLENGPSSTYADYFDIDWNPLKSELKNKVLLPILGDQYGKILENGELKLAFEGGAFFLYYYANKLPINPRTYNTILTPVLEQLTAKKKLSEQEQIQLDEFKSILTGLEYLPARTEIDPARIEERAREKEVLKRRIVRLCEEAPYLEEKIHQALSAFQGKIGDPRSFDALDNLIDAQAYRLSSWQVAAEEINYRRFFDINSLAAIRMEVPAVFEATHQLVFELLKNGDITGLRIDHPDGLYNPQSYFTQLQEYYAKTCGLSLPPDQRGLYLLAEKILVGDEKLRANWPIQGTTGYDFTTQVTELLVDSKAEKTFSETYKRFIDRHVHYPFLVYDKKRLVMRLSLANDVNVLGAMLNRISEHTRRYRDFTLNALTTAVREIIACFPVYRTYLVPGEVPSEEDKAVISQAVEAAKRRNFGIQASVFHFIEDILLFKHAKELDAEATLERDHFVMKFQQCTGPIMAKGLEDTAFYIYNRLVALNEVGGEPNHFGSSVEAFHKQCAYRQQHWPHSMVATSSHDTKRSEDVRARIAALSELPQEWKQGLVRWSRLNRQYKTVVHGEYAPDNNEEYLLYQIILGTWPLNPLSEEEHATWIARIQDYMTKAIKEAKSNSSWIQPNDAWDEAVRRFVAKVLTRGNPKKELPKYGLGVNHFLRAIEPFAEKVCYLGALNSLTQLILKLTVAGVPDIYQGNEIWDYSLVDPDNRRPVDYAKRRQMLAALDGTEPKELLTQWRDEGRIKLFITRALLRHRREFPQLYSEGSYEPLPVEGQFAEHVIAFQRKYKDQTLVVVVPRFTSKLGLTPPIGPMWGDTRLLFPDCPSELKHLITGETIVVHPQDLDHGVGLKELLTDFPFGVLIKDGAQQRACKA